MDQLASLVPPPPVKPSELRPTGLVPALDLGWWMVDIDRGTISGYDETSRQGIFAVEMILPSGNGGTVSTPFPLGCAGQWGCPDAWRGGGYGRCCPPSGWTWRHRKVDHDFRRC